MNVIQYVNGVQNLFQHVIPLMIFTVIALQCWIYTNYATLGLMLKRYMLGFNEAC